MPQFNVTYNNANAVAAVVIVRRRPRRTPGGAPTSTTELVGMPRVLNRTSAGKYNLTFNVTGASIGANNKALLRVVALLTDGSVAIVDGPGERDHP